MACGKNKLTFTFNVLLYTITNFKKKYISASSIETVLADESQHLKLFFIFFYLSVSHSRMVHFLFATVHRHWHHTH